MYGVEGGGGPCAEVLSPYGNMSRYGSTFAASVAYTPYSEHAKEKQKQNNKIKQKSYYGQLHGCGPTELYYMFH